MKQAVKISKRDEQAYADWIAYQQDPCGFMVDILGMRPEYLWPKMREVAESVRDKQLTLVLAGHSVSKTYGAGRLVVWFKSVFQPSTVITTAPSDNLVSNQLWREIHAAYAGSKVRLGGNMTSLMWDFKPSKSVLASLEPSERELWEKNFAIGFSTSPDTVTEHATKMHGWHNKYVFILLDECFAIMPQIWRAVMDGLVTNERVKVLAIGNPTDPNCEAAEACKPGSGWNVINISVTDTPNFKEGRELIPSVAGREYEERMAKQYGVGSNDYKIRVLGQLPEYSEGTFWGSRLAKAEKEDRVGFYPPIENVKVYTAWDLGKIYTAILFIQLIRDEVRVIDFFYDNTGIGLPGYAKVLQTKPYIYAEHWTGPDILGSNRKSESTGRAVMDDAALLGIHFRVVEKHFFADGLEAVRDLWPKIRIHKDLCQDFITACRNYKLKKNERLSTASHTEYFEDPVKDWTRHPMDALRHFAWAYRYQIMVDGLLVGYPQPLPAAWLGNTAVRYEESAPFESLRRKAV